MQFDTENKIVKLCAKGMEMEGEGKKEEAFNLFQQAWDEAETDIEKFTSAHYVARHQETIDGKLKWDQIALDAALTINDETIKNVYPSLYLNVGKCYEDLNDFQRARENYQKGLSFTDFLTEDGYGRMIKNGILNGLERVK